MLGLASLGVHYERHNWGLHLEITLTTDTVDTSQVTGNPDTTNDFSTLMFEWRM